MITASKGTRLHVVLGKSFSLAVVLGSVIGVGILRMPGFIVSYLPDYRLTLVAWLAGGLFALLGAFCFSELGTMLPHAGGPYHYVSRALGKRIGFMIGWADWLAFCSVLALLLVAIAEYAAGFFLVARNTRGTAAVILLAFVLLNLLGIRTSKKIQEYTSFIKVATFAILIGGCLVLGQQPFSSVFSGTGNALPSNLASQATLAVQMIIGTYAGWHAAVYFTEEDANVKRNLPRAMIAGVAIVTAVYLLMNLAMMRALDMRTFSSSELPAADSAVVLFGTRSGPVITALALWSLLSVVSVYLLSSTRILFALCRDHDWKLFSGVSISGAPAMAMLASAAVALALILTRSFIALVAAASFILVIVYCGCFISQMVLHWKEPFLDRPFKAWGYPWTMLVALAGSVAMLIAMIVEDRENSIYTLAFLLGTYGLYRLGIGRVSFFLQAKARSTSQSEIGRHEPQTTIASVRTTSPLQ
jgi:basic amino acid/polyamine antiporter, APA family